MLRKEFHLTALNSKDVFLKIDTCLVSFEHVKTKKKVDIAALEFSNSEKKNLTGRNDRNFFLTSIIVNEQGR